MLTRAAVRQPEPFRGGVPVPGRDLRVLVRTRGGHKSFPRDQRPARGKGSHRDHRYRRLGDLPGCVRERHHPLFHPIRRFHLACLGVQYEQRAGFHGGDLLFHLGRRILGCRILIVGAYRPEDLGLTEARHPLENVLAEFKRSFGDIWVELDRTPELARRRFVDELLDCEPNQLSSAFRQALFNQTRGQPLFTVELLRAYAERRDPVLDLAAHRALADDQQVQVGPIQLGEGVEQARLRRLLSSSIVSYSQLRLIGHDPKGWWVGLLM